MGIIVEAIQSAIFWLLLTIDAIVYSFINWVYQVILLLAQGDIFRNSTVVDQLVNRIYIIIGVIVLFLVAYSLLKSMVNPDEGLKGKDSPVKIIQNVLISIVLIAIVPTVFDFAMEFQNSFLLNNTLGKIILGTGTVISPEGEEVVEIDSEDAIANGGMTMASTVFRAFFTPKQVEGENVCIGDPNLDSKGCTEVTINDVPYSTWWNNMINSNNFYMITQANDEVINDIDYRFIISTAAGIFVLIVLISYCIDLAVRMVKLALYQLIAPLPILLRIVPQDTAKKVFDNWIKATLSTYLEVFIRLGILYFVVLIINVFVTNVGTIFGTTVNNIGTVNPIIVLIAQALVILGIILFMKQAPQIIKELTGLDSGKYGFFSGLKEAAGALKTGTAFVGGTIAGRNPLAGFRAARETNKSGNLRSVGEQLKRRYDKKEAKELGATFGDRSTDRIRQAFGLGTKLEQANRNIEKGRDIKGRIQKVINDTGADIELKDDSGRIIDTIKAGDREVLMNEQRLNNLQHQKDLNKRAISEIEEQIRQLKDFQAVNSKFIDIRSKIKSEAIDKIAEGDSKLTDELKYNGQTVASGNYKSLSDFYQSRINAGASQEELSELSRQLKSIQDKLWVQYANDEIAKGNNTKIGSLFQQGLDVYNTTQGYYDTKSGTFKMLDPNLNIANMEFFEGDGINSGIDRLSKMNNSELDINISRVESGKTPINEQNTQIDRLTTQLEELKAAAKTSPEYQKYKASDNANKISDSGKK